MTVISALPSVSNVTGLPSALNSKRVLVASSQMSALNPYRFSILGSGFNTGTIATNMYSRVLIRLPYGVTNPRLFFTNFSMSTIGETVGTGPLTPICAIETAAGDIYPCTFGGNTAGGTFSQNGGQSPLISDPVNIYVAPVSEGGPGYVWARTWINLQIYAYTDLVIDGTSNNKVSSSARPFTSADVGLIVRVTGGTGFTVGSYTVSSVTAGVATLSGAVGTVSSTGGTASLAPDFSVTGVTVQANGDYTTTNTTSSDPTTISTGAANSTYSFYPTGIAGILPVNTPSVFVEGDSISVPIPGYIFTPLSNVVPLLHAGCSGNSATQMQTRAGSGRFALLPLTTHLYREMNINDFRGITARTAQELINLATYDIHLATASNVKVILQTLTPFSSNSPTGNTALGVWCDNQAGQTPQSNDAARRCYNDWVRGVPLATLNSKYSITLSAGTKTPAQLGVTLPCVDVAALLETDVSNNLITISPTTGQSSGGYYRVPTAATATITAGAGTTTTSIKGTFTNGQYQGYMVKITSGAAAGQYASISACSTTALTISPALGTTPATGDSVQIWPVYTADGTHPSTGSNPNGDATLRTAGVVNPGLFKF